MQSTSVFNPPPHFLSFSHVGVKVHTVQQQLEQPGRRYGQQRLKEGKKDGQQCVAAASIPGEAEHLAASVHKADQACVRLIHED
jgi:hypothetical protein